MRTTLLVVAPALALALILGATAGCATSGTPATHFAGEPFDLAQSGARISGQVCGMDLDVDVRRSGERVSLSGFLDGKFPVQLTARPDGDGRRIDGALGTKTGDGAVELHVRPDALEGNVGYRRFTLRADGENLAGTMLIAGAIEPSDALLEGRAQLAALPLDTQAALLPALLTCNVQKVGTWGRSSLVVRVGGSAGALPHESSSLYTND
jgi:hypothetical protein